MNNLIYTLEFISVNSLFLIMGLLYQWIPIKKFKLNEPKYQLVLSICSFVSIILAFILRFTINDETVSNMDLLLDKEWLKFMFVFPIIFLFASIYKYKESKSHPIDWTIIELDGNTNDIDNILHDTGTLPSDGYMAITFTKTLSINGKNIVFLANAPTDMTQPMTLYCKKDIYNEDQNIYYCSFYDIKHKSIKEILWQLFGFFTYISFVSITVSVHWMNNCCVSTGSTLPDGQLKQVFGAPILFALGSGFVRMVHKNKTIIGWIFRIFGILMIFAGIGNLFL